MSRIAKLMMKIEIGECQKRVEMDFFSLYFFYCIAFSSSEKASHIRVISSVTFMLPTSIHSYYLLCYVMQK